MLLSLLTIPVLFGAPANVDPGVANVLLGVAYRIDGVDLVGTATGGGSYPTAQDIADAVWLPDLPSRLAAVATKDELSDDVKAKMFDDPDAKLFFEGVNVKAVGTGGGGSAGTKVIELSDKTIQ